MCVIYACYSATPNEEQLSQGAENNRDGAGIAWIDKFNTDKASVHWLKGMPSTAKAVLDAIETNKITYPFMIHYRTASIGGKTADLTHPFPITDRLEPYVSGKTRRVLMHNGHLNDWKVWFKQIMFSAPEIEIPHGPWSDSRALAAVVNVKGEGVLDFVIETSRVVILDAIASAGYKKTDPKSYIRTYGTWLEKEGWYQSVETFARMKVIDCKNEDWRRGRGCHRSANAQEVNPAPAVVHAENAWTVDELEGLITTLRKEQDEARILLGV